MRGPPSSSRSRARSRQHGPPAALLEPPQEVRPGLPLLVSTRPGGCPGGPWAPSAAAAASLCFSFPPLPHAAITRPDRPCSLLPSQPRVLQPPRPHSQVRPEYVPAVLPPVRQGYRLYQGKRRHWGCAGGAGVPFPADSSRLSRSLAAGLSAGRMRLSPEAPGASLGVPDTSAASQCSPTQ